MCDSDCSHDTRRRGSTRFRLAALAGLGVIIGAAMIGSAAASTTSVSSPSSTAQVRQQGTVNTVYSPRQTYLALGNDCRVLDTRKISGGRLVPGQTKTFDLTGKCGIPVGTSAIEATITSTAAAGSGSLSVFVDYGYAGGPAKPGGVFMNFTKSLDLSTAGAIPVTYPGAGNINGASHSVLNVAVSGAATDIVIDMRGYYTAPRFANVDQNGEYGTGGGSSGVTGVSHAATGSYVVSFAGSSPECSLQATFNSSAPDGTTTADGTATATFRTDGSVAVHTFDRNGAPIDHRFFVSVDC